MTHLMRFGFLTAVTLLSFAAGAVLSGCGGPADGPQTETGQTTEPDLPPKVAAALEQLPEEDRAAAIEQRTCPVTDELLGSMGKPVKVTVNERDVFLCCAACEDELRANPDEYLAKLDAT